MRLRIPGQSFQVLQMLLAHPGNLVTREEMQKALWPSDTFVDFDHGLSAAVNRLRDALGDSADEPHYIETLPRRGYRFIGAIEAPKPATETETAKADPTAAPPSAVEVASTSVRPSAASLPARIPKRITALVLTGAICLAVLLIAYRHWKAANTFTPHVVQLTALGYVGGASLSPDGTRLAIEWSGPGVPNPEHLALYVKTIGDETVQPLTESRPQLLTPAWSPDGSQLAFHRIAKDGNGGIYLVPSQGGSEKKLYSTHASFGRSLPIAWSPDGKLIAFANAPFSGGHLALSLLSIDTLAAKQIEHNDRCQDEAVPAFSHDGKYLAYLCYPTSSDFAIALVTSDGSGSRIVKEFKGYNSALAWTGDNKRLLFNQFQTGSDHTNLRELTIADGSVRDLPFGKGAEGFSISAKGDRFTFAVESGGNNTIWRSDLTRLQDPPVELISSTRDQLGPKYSPDGTHILFVSDRTGAQELWMSDAAGSNVVQLTHVGQSSGSPDWSPDGKKIAFDSRTPMKDGSPHADVYIFDLAERVPRKLNVGTGEASIPTWSHDGRWIYFIAGGGGGEGGGRIFRVPSQGGQPIAISSSRGYLPKESLDGRYVYFALGSSPATLLMASLNPIGTESRVEGVAALSFNDNWTVTLDGIYFYPADDFSTLSYFDFASKRVHPILKGQLAFYGISVSPDGHYLAYAKHHIPKRDIMLIDNFR
ncbi:MAG: winged helix-turn-helix domain-containing protein [Candidatus Acidiferrum sp.]|jgi:Tol biopolymer transport system component/DNA-binding winged helix-turn-helix (wHTH) protein